MKKCTEDLATVNALAKEICSALNLKKSLLLQLSTFETFSEFSKHATDTIKNSIHPDIFNIEKKYDFIVGDLPFGMRRVEWSDEKRNIKVKTRQNWVAILQSLFLLTEKGYGLFLIEPAFWSTDWKRFTEVLNGYDFYLNAVFNPPEKMLYPHTKLQPYLVLISRKDTEKLFIAEAAEIETIQTIISNFLNESSSRLLEEGTHVSREGFRGFYNYRIKAQIDKLKTQYKSYGEYKLVDISKKIALGRMKAQFSEEENAIYIPRVGNSPVIHDLSQAKLKHQNYIQVVLNSSIIINKYAALFSTSDLGLLVLKSLFSGSIIPKISKRDLENVIIPVPSLEEQENIIQTHEKLICLEERISSFKSELSLNPKSANEIQDMIDEMMSQLNLLNKADKVRSIVRKGESKTIEFKQTLSFDIKTGKKEKYIETAALKTIVAFLNTEGGNLLVGVHDESEIVGLDMELKKFYGRNTDKFRLHFINLIKERIGENSFSLVNSDVIQIDNKKVFLVECKASKDPCWLDTKDFYIRVNPATNKLEGPKALEYIDKHFEKRKK